MECELPKNCMGKTFKKMPALKKGQVAVKKFDAELSLLQSQQMANATMQVQMNVMEEDGSLATKVVDMPVVNYDAL